MSVRQHNVRMAMTYLLPATFLLVLLPVYAMGQCVPVIGMGLTVGLTLAMLFG